MARAFDLVHRINKDTAEEESRIPFADEAADTKPDADEALPKKRKPKIELAFFYILLFIVFIIMGSTFISPTLFAGLFNQQPNTQTSPIASNTPQAGFSIDKDGQSTEEAGKELGLGASPTPTPAASPSPTPTTASSPAASSSTSTSAAAKIQVLNGTTREGAAAALRTELAAKGIVVGSVGNYTKTTVARTTIYYRPDHETAANQIKAVAGGILSETTQGIGSYDILVVIGKSK